MPSVYCSNLGYGKGDSQRPEFPEGDKEDEWDEGQGFSAYHQAVGAVYDMRHYT